MSVLQPAAAELERREDTCVSDLARYIEALSGRLVITAKFKAESVDAATRRPRGDIPGEA